MVGDPRVESHDSDPRSVSRLTRLAPGTVLSGTVTRHGDIAVLNVGALRIRLSGDSRYPSGTRVRVRVRSERERVVLDLVSMVRTDGSDRSESDPRADGVRAALGRSAFAGANRATTPAQRYAAEVQRRGLAPPDGQTAAWEQLLSAVGILGDRESRQRQRRRDTGRGSLPTGTGGIEELRRATGNPDHPLQLFNALQSAGTLHWIVVPLSASFDQTAAVDAVLRVGVQLPEQRPLRAVLDVQDGRWLVYFDLSGGRADLLAVKASDPAPVVPQDLLVRRSDSLHTHLRDELAFAPEQQRRIDTYG